MRDGDGRRAGGRRALLGMAMAATAGAAAARLSGGEPAGAAPQYLAIGETNDAGGGMTTLTTTQHGGSALVVRDTGDASDVSLISLLASAYGGAATSGTITGVVGEAQQFSSNARQLFGVYGYAGGGEVERAYGVYAEASGQSGDVTSLYAYAEAGTAVRAEAKLGTALEVRGTATFSGDVHAAGQVAGLRFVGADDGPPAFGDSGRARLLKGVDRWTVTAMTVRPRTRVLAMFQSDPGGVAISFVRPMSGKFEVRLSGPLPRAATIAYFVFR